MKIKTIKINNFRSIRILDLTLDPSTNVFFGSNAAGKTTLLHALAIGLGAIVARVPTAKGRDFARTGDLRQPWLDHPMHGEQVGVASPYARVTLETTAGVAWDRTLLRSRLDRAPSALGLGALHETLDPLLREALDTPSNTPTAPLPLVALYGTERSMVTVPLRERDFNQDFHRFGGLDQALNATTHFKTVFEWFLIMEDEERREQIERRDFDFRLPALEWVRRAVQRAELRCAAPRVERSPLRMLVDFEQATNSEELNITSLSDGYRTHFSLIVDIARRMVQLNPSDDLDDPARGTNTAAVILIDEIDVHLDPEWQGRVVRGLNQAFPNAQLILTTHSEQVIASVPASSVHHLIWNDGAIEVEPVPFAQGATSDRILVELMNAPVRVEGPTQRKLEAYLRLIGDGDGTSEEAQRLRAELDHELQDDPVLHRADLELQRRTLMRRFTGGEP